MDIIYRLLSTGESGFSFLGSLNKLNSAVPKERLSDREKAICRRICAARKMRSLTQEKCAELTGVKRSTLANYEAEITPLGYDEAKRICYRLNLNQHWLATGILPAVPYFDLSPNLEFQIKPNSLFSKAFDEVLRIPVLDRMDELVQVIGKDDFIAGNYDSALLDNFNLVGERPGASGAFYVEKLLKTILHWMPDEFQVEFQDKLIQAFNDFKDKHGERITKTIVERQKQRSAMLSTLGGQKQHLTDAETKVKHKSVKLQLPTLLDRLNQATIKTGKMSELATELGVPLASVSRWLSGKREPGGEITLKMLKWVEDQERQ